jgi:hypothetical protein
MICPKCGAYVNDETRFCSGCGSDIKGPRATGAIGEAVQSEIKGSTDDEAFEAEMSAYAQHEAEKDIANGKKPSAAKIGLKMFGKGYVHYSKKNYFKHTAWKVAVLGVGILLMFIKNFATPDEVRFQDDTIDIDFSASSWQWEEADGQSYPAFIEEDSGDMLVLTDSGRLDYYTEESEPAGLAEMEAAESLLRDSLTYPREYLDEEGYKPIALSDRVYETEEGSYVYVESFSSSGQDGSAPDGEAVATLNPARNYVTAFATVLNEPSRQDADTFLDHVTHVLEYTTKNKYG